MLSHQSKSSCVNACLFSGVALLITAICSAAFAQGKSDKIQISNDARQVVNALLETHWQNGLEQRRSSQGVYAKFKNSQIEQGLTPDAIVKWSFVLNQIEHDQYRKAHAVIQEIYDADSSNWDIHHASIWLNLMVGQVNQALVEMQQLKQKMVADGNIDEATRGQIYNWLGQLYGYAEGPASKKASANTLAKTLAIITDGLNDQEIGAFEDQHKQVVQQYTGMLNEKSETVADRKQKQMAEGAQQRELLVSQNQSMDTRQAEIIEEVKKIRMESGDAIARLQSQASPLELDLRQLESRMSSSEIEMNAIVTDLNYLDHQYHHEEHESHRRSLLFRIEILRRRLNDEQRVYDSLRSRAAPLARELDVFVSQIRDIDAQASRIVARLNSESQQINSKGRKNLRQIKKLDNPREQKGYAHSMNVRTHHLPTYAPFPTTELRQGLLGRLQ